MKQDIICSGVPDAEMLGAAVGEFLRTVRPERQRLFDYYRGEQTVNKGETVHGRPDNRLRAPFPRYITEVHTGYFLGPPYPRLRRRGGRTLCRTQPCARSAAPLL